ncbi:MULTISPECIES: hypothetical protein [Saccharibacillus]|uniref:hypothetical protein n=1 Tax=Saccharibacillus TaxID=456492 RepID=UPI00123993CD|nr:hypothetical protein [Saccharibacillus sp. WB 17]MWJ31556.1 hypothetical protein [Saccharibacillus sp. WB 17]
MGKRQRNRQGGIGIERNGNGNGQSDRSGHQKHGHEKYNGQAKHGGQDSESDGPRAGEAQISGRGRQAGPARIRFVAAAAAVLAAAAVYCGLRQLWMPACALTAIAVLTAGAALLPRKFAEEADTGDEASGDSEWLLPDELLDEWISGGRIRQALIAASGRRQPDPGEPSGYSYWTGFQIVLKHEDDGLRYTKTSPFRRMEDRDLLDEILRRFHTAGIPVLVTDLNLGAVRPAEFAGLYDGLPKRPYDWEPFEPGLRMAEAAFVQPYRPPGSPARGAGSSGGGR